MEFAQELFDSYSGLHSEVKTWINTGAALLGIYLLRHSKDFVTYLFSSTALTPVAKQLEAVLSEHNSVEWLTDLNPAKASQPHGSLIVGNVWFNFHHGELKSVHDADNNPIDLSLVHDWERRLVEKKCLCKIRDWRDADRSEHQLAAAQVVKRARSVRL